MTDFIDFHSEPGTIEKDVSLCHVHKKHQKTPKKHQCWYPADPRPKAAPQLRVSGHVSPKSSSTHAPQRQIPMSSAERMFSAGFERSLNQDASYSNLFNLPKSLRLASPNSLPSHSAKSTFHTFENTLYNTYLSHLRMFYDVSI